VSNNRIAHLTNLRHLEQLEEFWASSNLLESFPEIERELGGLEGLHTVYFEHNPLQKTAGATYRNKVRLSLKAIKQIDATYGLV
jgi:protein phosphatase 1 regulatory subunit 7